MAVLLVLGRHKYFTRYWFQAGWAGVDLFFVLTVVAVALGAPRASTGPILSEVFFLHGYAGFVSIISGTCRSPCGGPR